MVIRAWALLLLLTPAAATAQIFDLDERIRPRPDTGRYVLPGPFDADARLPITAGGVLEGCEATYASCEPVPVTCFEPPCCSEGAPDPGDTLHVGRPLLPNGRPTLLRVNVMSGGSCYGKAQQNADILYFNMGDLGGGIQGPSDDCFVCTVALWMYAVGLFEDCPADCMPGKGGAILCALFGAGVELSSTVRPQALQSLTSTLRSFRDGTLLPTEAGQHYASLYATLSPELIRVTPRRPWLVWMMGDGLEAWLPAFAALAGGTGSSVVVTSQMIADLEAILDELAVEADEATRSAIAAERARLDPPSFAGLDMDAAWLLVQQRFAGEPTGCGDGFAGADCALGELLADDLCDDTAIDAALLALYETKVAKARAVLAKAAAGGRPGKVRRLLRKTAKHLGKLDRRTQRAKALDDGCRTTLSALLAARREQVLALGG